MDALTLSKSGHLLGSPDGNEDDKNIHGEIGTFCLPNLLNFDFLCPEEQLFYRKKLILVST